MIFRSCRQNSIGVQLRRQWLAQAVDQIVAAPAAATAGRQIGNLVAVDSLFDALLGVGEFFRRRRGLSAIYR